MGKVVFVEFIDLLSKYLQGLTEKKTINIK